MNASRNVLSLAEALQRWCDNSLVQRVRDEECRHTEYEMDNFSRIQLTSRAMRRQPHRQDWMVGSNLTRLIAAWEDLECDLRQRIEQGRIHLRGVQLAPDRRTEPEIIPRVWAADFRFDFQKGVIKAGNYRFGAVICSREPWSAPEASDPTPSSAAQRPVAELRDLRPEDFSDLDDETVLALLEEHADRVVRNDTKLIAPGKVTLLPIVRRKMRWRASNGEMLPTMIAESEWLAAWMIERVGSFQLPTAPTIAQLLGKEYELIKPRSTPAI